MTAAAFSASVKRVSDLANVNSGLDPIPMEFWRFEDVFVTLVVPSNTIPFRSMYTNQKGKPAVRARSNGHVKN